MNFINKALNSLLRNSKTRAITLTASIVVIVMSISTIAGTFIYQLGANSLPTYKPIRAHLDLPRRTMESFTQSLSQTMPADLDTFKNSTCTPLTQAGLAAENAKPGVAMSVDAWRNADLYQPQGSALWLDQSSVSCGQTVSIHASTFNNINNSDAKLPRTFKALRIGWYGGSGARVIWSSAPTKLKLYPVQNPHTNARMIETNWPVTLKFTVDNSWVPGFYLITSYSSTGHMEAIAPLVVRNPVGTSHLALINSFLTWQMYNSFGGRSGYLGPGGTLDEIRGERSRVVSFDRPYAGSGEYSIRRDAISMTQFLEKNNVLVDQYADLDINNNPSITTDYNGLVFSGHAEYMPRQMFDALIAARNNGTNIAFFGANNAYWQTRLEPSPIGKDRRVVMYRVSTQDPDTNWDEVTLEYDDKRVNTPSNLITGELTSGVHVFGAMQTQHVPHWLNIPKNSVIENISPDSEIEGYFDRASAPKDAHVLFQGGLSYQIYPGGNVPKIPLAQSIWFTTPSGAAIFNGGFTTWACDLSDACVYPSITATSESILQKTTLTILKLWAQKDIGPQLDKGEASYIVTKTNPLLAKPIQENEKSEAAAPPLNIEKSVVRTPLAHTPSATHTASHAPATKTPENHVPTQSQAPTDTNTAVATTTATSN